MNEYFKPLPAKSSVFTSLYYAVLNAKPEDWLPYYNFHALPIPETTLMQDPILRQFEEMHIEEFGKPGKQRQVHGSPATRRKAS